MGHFLHGGVALKLKNEYWQHVADVKTIRSTHPLWFGFVLLIAQRLL